jgi:hypothetical protein
MQERRKEPSNGDAERTVKWRAEGVANKGQSVCRGHFLQCTQSDDDGAKSYDLNSYLILSSACHCRSVKQITLIDSYLITIYLSFSEFNNRTTLYLRSAHK